MKHDYKFDGKEWVDAVEARCLALHSELTEASRKIAALQQAIDKNYIRLDDPVVTGLAAAATANLQALRETLRIFRQNGFIYPEGRMAVNETKEALSAYEARVKEVSRE